MSQMFISYSRKDAKWLDIVKVHLKPLVRDGFTLWDDTRIQPGAEWKKEIKDALADASVAVLLVGPNFLASDFVQDEEMPRLLAAAKAGGTTILSLIIAPCFFEHFSALAQFQTINPPNRPLIALSKNDQHEYCVRLVRRIKEIFAKQEKATREAEQAQAEASRKAEQERQEAATRERERREAEVRQNVERQQRQAEDRARAEQAQRQAEAHLRAEQERREAEAREKAEQEQKQAVAEVVVREAAHQKAEEEKKDLQEAVARWQWLREQKEEGKRSRG